MANKHASDGDIGVSELTKKQKETVEKIHRQLSRDSVLSIDTEIEANNDRNSEGICKEDAETLQQVIQAFHQFRRDEKSELAFDEVDGTTQYTRFESRESYELSNTGSTSGFVNPGRFYVRVTEETKKFVQEVYDEIQREKPEYKYRSDEQRMVVVKTVSNLSSSLRSDETSSRTNDQYRQSTRPSNCLQPNDITVQVSRERTTERYKNGNSQGLHQLEVLRDSNGMHNKGNTIGYDSGLFGGRQQDIPFYCLPPRERFRQAVKRVIRDRRRNPKKKKDYSALWKKRGNAGWFNLIFTIIGFGAFFADGGTDLKVAVDHFIAGDYWWGSFTVLLVLFPALLVNMVSFFWYKEDEEKVDRKPASGWKVVSVFHLLQLGLIERYWRLLVKGYRIKRKKLTDVWHYQLYIAMNLDIAMLQMILAFTEDAPQLVLQLYVLIRRHLLQTLQTTSLRDLWTMASIFFSFVSYSRAVVNYIACLRDSKKHKGRLKWYGYVSMWFWRAFMFTSRILVLVFFATEFHLWFFLVLFLHLLIILALMWRQKVSFFPDERWMQNCMRIVIAYIHTFCFFVLEAGKTIQWAAIFYGLTFVEALVFSLLWYTNYTRYLPLQVEIAGISVIFVCYVLGILMMVVYYKFLHAKFKRPQLKWHTASPPQEEMEEVEEEEDEMVDERQENERCEDVQRTQRNRDTGNLVYKQFEVWV